jgi:DeoR family fructose operon transcriptional repressor
MLQHDRQGAIYVLALENGSVDVSDLARRFDVTTETIRRDLSDLQERNLLRRVHGGAVPAQRSHHEPMVDARGAQNTAEKLRIAREAIHEVPEDGSVIIDSGSSGQRLAEVFPADRNVHVVTNSLATALTLARRGVRNLSVLGGTVRTNTYAMVDPTAIAALASICVDVLFISCDGLSLDRGLTTLYREEFLVKRAMVESSRRVVALVDHSKFDNNQMFAYAAPDEIDTLITDARADDEEIARLNAQGVEVRRV